MSNIIENIGENIRSRRKLLEKSQGEIAKNISVSTSQMSKWENEISFPAISRFVQLSYSMNIRPESLVVGKINENMVEEKDKKDRKWMIHIILLSVLAGVLCIRLVIDVYFKFHYFNGEGAYQREILYEKPLEDGTVEIRQLVKSRDKSVWIDVITYQSGDEIIDGSVLEIIFTNEYVDRNYTADVNKERNAYIVRVYYLEDDITRTVYFQVNAVKQ